MAAPYRDLSAPPESHADSTDNGSLDDDDDMDFEVRESHLFVICF